MAVTSIEARMSDPRLQRQARWASAVVLVAFTLWMAGSWIGGALGLPVRFAFLLDLAALAAFVWALVVLYRVWRARNG